MLIDYCKALLVVVQAWLRSLQKVFDKRLVLEVQRVAVRSRERP